MSERQWDGYVVEGELSQVEDPNKNYISRIIGHVKLIIKRVPFLVEGEELRGEYQESYEKILGLFQQIEEEYNGLSDCIETDFDIEEVKESLRSTFNGTYEKFIRENLSVVFPEKLAEVNIPEFCQAEEYAIPDVRRWQHANEIISPELADREYMRFIAEAREAVTDSLTEDGAFGLPDDFTITRPERIPGNDGKMKLSSLLEDFERRKLKEVEDEECNGINPEGDLKFANSVLKFIKSIKLPSEEELTKQYKEATIKENIPVVRSLAESMAKEHLSESLDDALRVLSEKLNGYEVAPKIAAESLNKAKKRKRKKQSRQDNCEVSDQNIKDTEVNLKVGDYIELSHETFPWLDDEMAKVLYIKRSGNDVTIVVDARTEAAKRIEHRMSGYETKKKQKSILPSLYNKLKLAAEIVATSDSGLRDSWTTLRYRDKNKYPFSIFSWKAQTSDALRMYVSHIAVDKVDDESVRKILEENGVTHLLMLLGACDKNNQEELLPVFTGRTRRIEAADGAGV
ncbi:hypothetical protein LRM42_00575 [Candidatus Nanosynbacter sp. TM7-075]|uniref:hypothetical protein n=1 Tax=Candidatus Nanosynbacter sp. TM7-075 TaxID=2902633 RepID=UPI001FB62892|nr:hypothetical protein [Candidatus Nanosynbacter sp. TM7-075]MCJ1966815.1 hypothetical protein [Candidatus Nanosynbacter sp. TM7-075]